MKINFKFEVENFDGQVLPGNKLSVILASSLERAQLSDEYLLDKYEEWSKALYKAGELDLGKADLTKLREFIIADPFMYAIAKQPLRRMLKEAFKKLDAAEERENLRGGRKIKRK